MLLLLISAVASRYAADWNQSLNGYCAKVFTEYENPTSLSLELERAYRSSRVIPPLEGAARVMDLIHVQSMIRLGARAPLEEHIGRFNMEDTVQWNCSFNETFLPEEIQRPLFYKMYDASPQHNLMKGTCAKGQLLAEGAYQTRILGDIVREAYFSDNNVFKDKSKSLVDPTTADTSDAFSKLFYVRSTDKSQTRLSAANFMSTVLEAFDTTGQSLPIHTIDIEHETLDPNLLGYCPEVTLAFRLAASSAEKRALEKIDLNIRKAVYDAFDADLDEVWPWGVMDIIKSHICAGKIDDLPFALQPLDEDRQDFMARALKAADDEGMFKYHYDNALFSKASMVRLVVDMKAHFLGAYAEYANETSVHDDVLDGQVIEFQQRIDNLKTVNRGNVPKFVLRAAHAQTLMSLLASLDIWQAEDGHFVFPPFASMLNFEYYAEPLTRTFYVRILYNGETITSRLEGCQGRSICSVIDLFTASPFASPEFYADSCPPHKPSDGSRMNGTRMIVLLTMAGGALFV
ncbi:MAG: hypothetical protein KVP17_004281 [Porospora cf. gigantea B]|uniref:uncharacterized protein n=1 Tax=Porospora cf. gigantea B TaxID=2853592 RepID=UPI0035717AE3|nr:MAG: hypothetical protein KVP17_004281 [Porospora cf. gigantea B]